MTDWEKLGRRAAVKGADYERTIANELTELSGIEHVRNLEETRDPVAVSGGDVVTRQRDGMLAIQCKVGIRVNAWKAYREAEESARVGQMPVAIVKANRGGSSVEHTGSYDMQERVVLSKSDFYMLLVRADFFSA